jgi:hypothetical protein
MREISDTDDAVAFDRDVSNVACTPGAIHDPSVSDQDIVLRCL